MPHRTYHHGDLRNALLAEAATVVESEGVTSLTLREIARRLGVSHAAPTHHFPDKSALLVALGADGFESLAKVLEAPGGDWTPAERFFETAKRYVHFARTRPGHFRVMFGGSLTATLRAFRTGVIGADKVDPRLPECSGRAFQALEAVVAAVLPNAAPDRARKAAFLTWSTVHGCALLVLEGPLPLTLAPPGDDSAVDELIEHAIKAIYASILVPPPVS